MQPAQATWQALLTKSWRCKREGGRRDGAPEGAGNACSLISEPTNHQISAECTTLEANYLL